MIYILAGTNRKSSRTLLVAQQVYSDYQALGEQVEVIDLSQVPMLMKEGGHHYDDVDSRTDDLQAMVEKINQAQGLVIVTPEYNGSYPGILKYFIDHWTYPESFEFRPVCFIGLGGRFGGLRPVEHLQQVFNYRNAFVYPVRVFLFNVWELLKEGRMTDPSYKTLLKDQAHGFIQFIQALQSQKIDAQSRKLMKKT